MNCKCSFTKMIAILWWKDKKGSSITATVQGSDYTIYLIILQQKSARINQTLFEYRWPIKGYNVAFWLATFCKYLKQLTFANKITLKLDDLHHVNTIRDIFLALQKPQEGKKENWNKNHSSQETNLRKRTFRSSLRSIHKSLLQRTNKSL